MRKVYFDNAATTKVLPQIAEKMQMLMMEEYGNPSSIYKIGQRAAAIVAEARQQVATLLNADASEIIFTGGGSEGNTMLLLGAARAYKKIGRHIITTAVEHHAVLHTCAQLEKEGFEVTYLPVNAAGLITAQQVLEAIRQDTILVSVMYANNEIGTIMPIREIGRVCREKKVLFHTDAVQAAGHLPVDVKQDNIDLLTLTAHKFHGPKGVGAVYIRKGIRIEPLIYGGAQERGLRPGTENTIGIAGLGMAAKHALIHLEENGRKIALLRDKLINGITKLVPEVILNGDSQKRLPNNVNFSIKYIEGESLLLLLDAVGIAASSGSACTSGALDPSHVLLAIGLPHETAHGSLRLTLSEFSTEEEVEYLLEQLPPIVERLRLMSPLYHGR